MYSHFNYLWLILYWIIYLLQRKGGKKRDFSYFFFPSQELNLSFQDLGDLYQVENFKRILRRLIRVEKLWLVDNSLTDLSAIRLPR